MTGEPDDRRSAGRPSPSSSYALSVSDPVSILPDTAARLQRLDNSERLFGRASYVSDPAPNFVTRLPSRLEHRTLCRRDAQSIQALQTGGLCQAEWKPGPEDT